MRPNEVCLKFTDEAEFLAAIAGLDPALGVFDVIGPLVQGGQWSEDGTEIVAPVVTPGWHVNLALYPGQSLPENLQSYLISPATPFRIFG
jgi:hypothetical protein